MEISAIELERRRKISESKKGRKRPDVSERNRQLGIRPPRKAMTDAERERLSQAKTTHGHGRKRGEGRQGTPTYYIWGSMVQRCTNPKNKDYPQYGGRGITVCERWRDFANFLADMGEKPQGRSIDRIDVNGSYELANCRWATPTEQGRNQRKCKLTDADVAWIRANPQLTVAALAEKYAVGKTTIVRVRRREGRFA